MSYCKYYPLVLVFRCKKMSVDHFYADNTKQFWWQAFKMFGRIVIIQFSCSYKYDILLVYMYICIK